MRDFSLLSTTDADMCYCKDTVTGARTSLATKDLTEGEKLIRHINEDVEQPHINRKIGLAYLSAADPELVKRTWDMGGVQHSARTIWA